MTAQRDPEHPWSRPTAAAATPQRRKGLLYVLVLLLVLLPVNSFTLLLPAFWNGCG